MRLARFLFTSSLTLGLLLVIRSLFLKPQLSLPELQNKIDAHLIAAIKSTRLVMEKSSSSFLRELTQRFYDDLINQEEKLTLESQGDFYSRNLLIEAESLVIDYDYNEEFPFDLAYASHQLHESANVMALLREAIRVSGSNDDRLSRSLSIFTHYHSELDKFIDNFLTINEYRIRDVAHQIWEAEGRPEGQSIRHWSMAVELLKKISTADLQLALEQKRSLFDAFSTAPEISGSLMNKNIH